MKITLAVVTSIDGRTTRGDEQHIYDWTSDEDWQHFVALRDASDVVIIGRHGYEVVREKMRMDDKSPLRVVITNHPEAFADEAVPGKLEFTNEYPLDLVRRFELAGYKQILLASGQRITASFLRHNLVDDIYCTVEPRLFGSGKGVAFGDFDIKLRLISSEKLNDQGTLLLHYEVDKENKKT